MSKLKTKATEAGSFLETLTSGPPSIGRTLRSIRLGEEETQAEFARKLGITTQNLSDIENERRGVSVERAAAWAEILGYHVGQFIELAMQAQIRAAGLPFVVKVEPEASAGKRRRRSKTRAA